jgi:epoxyqueuosine reductase
VAADVLSDPSPLVRAMAVWALSKLLDSDRFSQFAQTHAMRETDEEVRGEWEISFSRALPSR